MNTTADALPPSKADKTRAAIVDAALALFEEQGFDATTMRQIASRAGVSVGNTYYYFESKEQLVMAIYERFIESTVDPVSSVLDGPTELAARIDAAIGAWLDVMRPNHAFAAVIFRNVADPSSTMSPLSDASSPMREQSYRIWRNVLEGATDIAIPPDTIEQFVRVLWAYSMAVVVAWTQDPTPDAQRTKAVVKRSATLVARLISLAIVPALAPVVDEIRSLVNEIVALRVPIGV